jgi:hypothetical protein
MGHFGDDPYPTANYTPGLIVDDVSCLEQPHIGWPIHSFDFLGHARHLSATSSSGVSLDCHL